MSEKTTRRGLFGLLGRRKAETEQPRASEPVAPRDPSPWERRQQALASGRPESVARVLGYACIGGSPSFCTVCLEHCPVPGALEATGRAPRVNPDVCTGCGVCEQVCPAPDKAVHVLPRLPSGAAT